MAAVNATILAAVLASASGPQLVRSIVTDGFLQGPDRNIAVGVGPKGHRWDAWVARKDDGDVDRIVFSHRDRTDRLVVQETHGLSNGSTDVESYGGVVDDQGNFFVAYGDHSHQVVMRATPEGSLLPHWGDGITAGLVPVSGGGVIRCSYGRHVGDDMDVWVSRLGPDNAVVWENRWDNGEQQRVRGCAHEGDRLYAVSAGVHNAVRSYDPEDGHVRWTKPVPDVAPGLLLRDAFVHPSGDVVVVALTSRSGRESSFHFFRYAAADGKLTQHHMHPAGVFLTVSTGTDPEKAWVTHDRTGSAIVAYRSSGKTDTASWTTFSFSFDAKAKPTGTRRPPVGGSKIDAGVAHRQAQRLARRTLALPGGAIEWSVDSPSSLHMEIVGIVGLTGDRVGLVGHDEAKKPGEAKPGSRTRLVVIRGNGTIEGDATYTSSAADRQNVPEHVAGAGAHVFVGGQQSKISGPSFAEKDATRVHFALPRLNEDARKKVLRKPIGR